MKQFKTDYELSLVTYRFRNELTRVPNSTREEQDAEWVSIFGPLLFDPDNPDYMGDCKTNRISLKSWKMLVNGKMKTQLITNAFATIVLRRLELLGVIK